MSVKKFVLLAALALVAAMSIGATTASATIVTCGAGVACASGTSFNGTSTNSKLTSADGAITCTHSAVIGKLNGSSSAATGAVVPGQINSVHWSGCTDHIANCTVNPTITKTGVAWPATITSTTMVVHGPSVGVTMNCFGVHVTCTYSQASISGNISGSNVTFNAAMALSGGFGCPGGATWDGTYTVRQGTTVGSGTLVTVDH